MCHQIVERGMERSKHEIFNFIQSRPWKPRKGSTIKIDGVDCVVEKVRLKTKDKGIEMAYPEMTIEARKVK